MSDDAPDTAHDAPAATDAAAPADAGPIEPVLVPPRGLVASLLIALALVAVAAVRWPSPREGDGRPDLRLHSWADDADDRAAARDRELAAFPALPDEATISRGFAAWLGMEATLGAAVVDNAEARAQRAAVEEQVRSFGLRHGREATWAAALRWSGQVRQAVATWLLAPALGADAVAAARAVDAVAPGFAALALRMHLEREVERGDDGRPRLSTGAAMLIEALAADRYLELAVRLPPPRPELPTPWRRALLAARVERPDAGLDVSRRLELLDELTELDPTIPRGFILGVLLAQDRRFRGARAAFLAAAVHGEFPAVARSNARWCRRMEREQERLQERAGAPVPEG